MASVLMLAMLAAAALTATSMWRDAFRVFGARAPALGLHVMRLRMRQRVRYGTFTFQLLAVLLAAVYLLAMLLAGSGTMWEAIPAAIAGIVLLQFAVPPTVVFLGTSTDDGKRLFAKVRWAVPGRTLSLLQSGAFDVIHGPSFTRTTDPSWQRTVRELMTLAGMIVVDARVTSPAVRQEVDWIVHSELRHRTVFISGNDGRAAVLQELHPEVHVDELVVLHESDLAALPRRLFAIAK